ncbi:hypothetical protein ACWFNE_17165 [Cellulomonas sp. NPDC055163]
MDEHVDTARAVPLPSAGAFGGRVPVPAHPSGPAAPSAPGAASSATPVATPLPGASAPGLAAVAVGANAPTPAPSGSPATAADGSPRPTPASVRVARPAAAPRDVAEDASLHDGGSGDHAVDEAMTLLAMLEELPLREHVAVFDGVHAALQDRLADTEG